MSALIHSGSICLIVFSFSAYALADDESPMELSVAPLDYVQYPSTRPDWVSEADDTESRIHTVVVVTRPCDSYEECGAELNLFRKAAIRNYIRALCKSDIIDFYPIEDQWIEKHLVIDEYEGEVTVGDDKLFEQAIRMEFTPRVRDEIQLAWKNVQVGERLGGLGFLVAIGSVGLFCSSVLLGTFSRRFERRAA